MIVAYGKGRVIGKDNQLLWDIPGDIQHFRCKTLGKIVVMGRKTYESIGRPLEGRVNVVITRDLGYRRGGVYVINNVGKLGKIVNKYKEKEVIIIGGEQIYRKYIDKVNYVYVTYVDKDYEGDTYFPELAVRDWEKVREENGGVEKGVSYFFREYRRR